MIFECGGPVSGYRRLGLRGRYRLLRKSQPIMEAPYAIVTEVLLLPALGRL